MLTRTPPPKWPGRCRLKGPTSWTPGRPTHRHDGPPEGKSVRVARDLPVWALTQKSRPAHHRRLLAPRLANRIGRQIRNRILANPDLGLRIAPDNGAPGEWQSDGHDGGVYSVGIGVGVTGRACELLIIDDPIKSAPKPTAMRTGMGRVLKWWTDEAAASRPARRPSSS